MCVNTVGYGLGFSRQRLEAVGGVLLNLEEEK